MRPAPAGANDSFLANSICGRWRGARESLQETLEKVRCKFAPMPKEAATPSSDESLTFESAMRRLEEVVAEIEKGDLPLETLIARHEEGSRLVQVCTELLDSARKRVELVEENATGVLLKPLDVSVADQPPLGPSRAKDRKTAHKKDETDEDETGLL